MLLHITVLNSFFTLVYDSNEFTTVVIPVIYVSTLLLMNIWGLLVFVFCHYKKCCHVHNVGIIELSSFCNLVGVKWYYFNLLFSERLFLKISPYAD